MISDDETFAEASVFENSRLICFFRICDPLFGSFGWQADVRIRELYQLSTA